MKKKQSKKSSGMLAKYKAQKTKGDIKGTGIKTLVDLIIGATVGAGIGATAGKVALPIGLVLIAGSHYMGEDTGVLRLAGASSIAYGIAKAITEKEQTISGANNSEGNESTMKERLTLFKDELLSAFYLDKLKGDKQETSSSGSQEQIGSIDLSSLEVFDQNNHSEAMNYQSNMEMLPESSMVFEPEEFAFELADDPDLTSI